MWLKWLPWRFLVGSVAKSQGFLDPGMVLGRLARFSQPSEVAAPTELLRAGMVFHARGLMNSQAIQHNLDWVWPYWVQRQFNPRDGSFVPRAFSLTHVNLTHRNWTATGIPDWDELPIVDPRGLVTPLFDGWSIDGWIFSHGGQAFVPSRFGDSRQRLEMAKSLVIETEARWPQASLVSRAEVVLENGAPVCLIRFLAEADFDGWLAISLRPCNPEGVSFVHQISLLDGENGWKVDGHAPVYFDRVPDRHRFSAYRTGDVFNLLPKGDGLKKIECGVGMATAAALFNMKARSERQVTLRIPLGAADKKKMKAPRAAGWDAALAGRCRLEAPDERFCFLFESALRSIVLHAPCDTVYPGPYTYKRFWFRDASFILHALCCAGLFARAERILDGFPSRQTPFGYFLSQEGEWDSNGEALWIFRRFCELSGRPPKAEWKASIYKAAHWIRRKRVKEPSAPHDGLLPAGFSCEHLGPNDFYYWDDFWGVAGLSAAAYLARRYGDIDEAEIFEAEAKDFLAAIEKSLAATAIQLGTEAMPASPYRRLDTGSIGSIAAGYPLQLWSPRDRRILETADYLSEKCLVDGGFFHDMSHSGINPYLTLHIAQVFLRADDARFADLMRAMADFATPTGQWPEAIHPLTRGGCMGDGQHIWASAEWLLMARNCFVREEEAEGKLILFSGIPEAWLHARSRIVFGPAPTSYGPVRVGLETRNGKTRVWVEGEWFDGAPRMEARLPRHEALALEPRGAVEREYEASAAA